MGHLSWSREAKILFQATFLTIYMLALVVVWHYSGPSAEKCFSRLHAHCVVIPSQRVFQLRSAKAHSYVVEADHMDCVVDCIRNVLNYNGLQHSNENVFGKIVMLSF
ncbi:hypothetical protein ANCCAN_02676 [Ancylostoma caninum]|uniref:Uncharacterized protein n=1 Tax=Ancylostoma caninum TaxID=29170 RepID=A0A368H3D4_ANCCA|nr:hypothetical protein ANCCAN_02676 [Ancylostoma caninum]